MHLTINTKPNRTAVAFVAGLIPKSTTLPVLSHVRIGAAEEEVSISATDLDVTVAALLTHDGNTNAEACLLPGRKIADFFKKGNRITIESNCKKANISVDGNTFSLLQLKDDEWPKTPAYDPDYTFELPAAKLLDGIEHVRVAQSEDESRYVLNGILFRVEHSLLTLVATDGRRLHKILIDRERDTAWAERIRAIKVVMAGLTNGEEIKKLSEKQAKQESIDWIFPAGTVPHLVKLLKAADKEMVTLAYKDGGEPVATPVAGPVPAGQARPVKYVPPNPGRVRITSESLLLQSKLVDGNYPNYRQVIPTRDSIKQTVDVDVEAWLNALITVEPFTSEKCNSVKMLFADNLLTMTTKAPDVGEGKASLPINYTGKHHSIAFDPIYLIEAFRALRNNDHIKFGFTDELSPCLITTLTTETVIMPMRLS